MYFMYTWRNGKWTIQMVYLLFDWAKLFLGGRGGYCVGTMPCSIAIRFAFICHRVKIDGHIAIVGTHIYTFTINQRNHDGIVGFSSDVVESDSAYGIGCRQGVVNIMIWSCICIFVCRILFVFSFNWYSQGSICECYDRCSLFCGT
jgi:hypothetical protein